MTYLEQLEAARAELLAVAVDLAHRLRALDPAAAAGAAVAIDHRRRELGESPLLEATVTAEVLRLVEDALL